MATPSCISGPVSAAFVGIQMALLVFLPAATPAGFIAAQFRLGAFERLVVHHVEAGQTDVVDGGLLHLGNLLVRLLDFGAEVFQLRARLAREECAILGLDGGRRLAARAM